MSFKNCLLAIRHIAGNIMTNIDQYWDWEYIKQNTKTVSLSITLPITLSASKSLFARLECMKTVVFAAHMREGVVVAPVGVTNNMTVCCVSVN